jgi:phosphoribosylformylglycinamidine synthase
MPIAHGEGRFFADPSTLARLGERRQIVLRYCAPDGSLDPSSNPNGSLDAIAGVCNERRNVFGLMPHPERCSEAELGGTDGTVIFRSLLTSLREREPTLVGQGAHALAR